ncbi:amino acid adenylation domain-containing protein [Actinokineospora sp.]|uniref:amino acid adenylation domain-containing protein n=1 Tax=Actinokineospora sp. TaxID=1872133 RepID=UPI004037DBF6
MSVFPPSFGQQRLWFLDRFNPGSPLYNVPMVQRLRGPLDTDVLRASLDLIVARHDALRTVFEARDGRPVQVVLPAAAAALSIVDITESEVPERVAAEAKAPFDLATGPLLRVLLLRTAPDDHRLMVTLHHIVSDGWSLAVLLEELSAAYSALAGGARPDLPELTLQYPEYAQWQRDQLDGRAGAMALDYWVSHLRGAPMLLALPTDRPRPTTQSYRGDVHSFTLPAALADEVRTAGITLGGTLFMTLLAAYQALLSRYSGQDDIVVGTAVGGRSRVDAEPLIGFFVNTVPLRTSLADNPTFRALVSRVRDVTLDGIGYADVPLERIVETLQPERSTAHAPIFQAQLTLQSTPPPNLDLPGISVSEPDFVFAETSKFDLTLGANDHGGRLHVDLEYSTDLFDADTIERFADHFVRFLSAVVRDPDVRVRDVSLLTDADRDRALIQWNDTALPPAAAASTLDLFAAQVARRGDAVAVADPQETLSYTELDARANRLAHQLRLHGVDPETPVALCMERSVSMVVALLAVWKAGGGYLPLDPTWPRERLRYMLSDAGARIAVVDEPTRSRLAAALTGLDHVVCVDRDAAAVAAHPGSPPEGSVRGDDLAYVIYTSGSTGRPKGVVVPHTGVLNQLLAFDNLLALSTEDVWAAVTTLSFDPSVLELLLPLACGARVQVLDSAEAADPVRLRARLTECGATVLQATPSRWRMLLGAGGVPATVHTRLCGGEALTRELADQLIAAGSTLWNVYGPTETTVWAAAGKVTSAPIEIGPPIGNMRIYVLDEALRPVPVGVVGEIHIGGAGMTRGYHGRDDLTAERFVPDPFGAPGEKLYATGDLARYRPSGRLEFLGRVDQQVKVRGFRIELGEIEAALRGHPRVREAVVTASTVGEDDTRLAAYLVTDSAEPNGLWPQVRAYLADRLPEYMVPGAFVALDALPMTPTGKVDRSALPEPSWDSLRDTCRVAPRTPVERAVAEMWQELLNVPEVGAHDDFFVLGGHSLLVGRLLARVREYLLVDVPMRTMFDARTVAAFAAALSRFETAPGQVAAAAELRAEVAALPAHEVAKLLAGEGA